MAGESLTTLQKACKSEAQQIAVELAAVISENKELRAQIERLEADSLENCRIIQGLTRRLMEVTAPPTRQSSILTAKKVRRKIIPFKQALHRMQRTI